MCLIVKLDVFVTTTASSTCANVSASSAVPAQSVTSAAPDMPTDASWPVNVTVRRETDVDFAFHAAAPDIFAATTVLRADLPFAPVTFTCT